MAAYIERLSHADQAVVAAALTEISERGLGARGVTFRRIEGKLWEVRIVPHRVFYVLLRIGNMVLLHAYRKQSAKTPARHGEIAQSRMQEILL